MYLAKHITIIFLGLLLAVLVYKAEGSQFDPLRDYHPITITSARAERTFVAKDQVLSSASKNFDFDLKYAIGFAVSVPITCASPGCTGTIKLFAGVEDSYTIIDDVTTPFTGDCNIIINVTEAYYSQLRIEVDVTSATATNFDVNVTTKLGAK